MKHGNQREPHFLLFKDYVNRHEEGVMKPLLTEPIIFTWTRARSKIKRVNFPKTVNNLTPPHCARIHFFTLPSSEWWILIYHRKYFTRPLPTENLRRQNWPKKQRFWPCTPIPKGEVFTHSPLLDIQGYKMCEVNTFILIIFRTL